MLLSLAKQVALDSSGTPLAGARLYLFQADGSTPFIVYQDGDYSTQHAHPIEADANGVFPAIHIRPDASTDYRQVLKTSADVELWDVDDIQSNPLAVGSVVAPPQDGAVELGTITLVSRRWRNVVLSEAVIWKNSSYSTDMLQGNVTADRTVILPDADLILGGRYVNTKNQDYTFLRSDFGKTIYHSDASDHTYTIPANASVPYEIGCIIEVDNTGTGLVTVAPDTGVTLYVSGYSTSGSFVVARMCRCRLKKINTNTWTALDVTFVVGTAEVTLTGMTATITASLRYEISGGLCALMWSNGTTDKTGTSNTTAMTMTGIPTIASPAALGTHGINCRGIIDNGTAQGGVVAGGSTTLTFTLDYDGTTAFTGSGTKGLRRDWHIIFPRS